MQPLIKSGIFCLALLSFTACHFTKVNPEAGNLTTTTRPVSGFSGLRIEDGIQTTIVKGTTESVTIEAREGYQSYFKTEVVNGVLRIYIDNRLNTRNLTERRAVVTMKTLTSLNTSGGARVTSNDNFAPGSLSIKVSGGGYVGLPVTTDILTISGSGGSEFELSGTARTVTIDDLSGGSTALLANLPANACTVDASGGSVAEVNVSQELTVRASGGSRVRYRGTPRISQNLSGGSSVSQL